jgi:hypothetical protein
MRWRTCLLAAAMAAAAAASCRQTKPAPPRTRPETRETRTAATAVAGATERELERLIEAGRQAVRKEDHGQVRRATEGLAGLDIHAPGLARRRDQALAELRREAERLRDALHRFLFVELRPLPPARRADLLQRADLGDPRAIPEAGAALAAREIEAGRRYLRETSELEAGTTHAETDLTVKPAGEVERTWQDQINRAFNNYVILNALAEPTDRPHSGNSE